MVYNLTNLTGSKNMLQLAQYANQATDYWFGPAILTVILIATFFATKTRSGTRDAAAAALGITAFLSLLFFAAGLIGGTVLQYFLIGGAASILLLIFRGE